MGLKSDAVFDRIKGLLADNPDKAKSINGVFVYNITEGGKQVKQWSTYSYKHNIHIE